MPFRYNPFTSELDVVLGTGSGDPIEQIDADSGSATPTAGVVSLVGGTLINTSASGSTVTINADDSVVATAITDSGTVTGYGNNINIIGDGSILTSGSGDTVTINLSIPIVVASGGTGQSTYTTGDILYASASNTLSKLAAGSDDEVLTLASGVPTWAAAGGGGAGALQSVQVFTSTDTWTKPAGVTQVVVEAVGGGGGGGAAIDASAGAGGGGSGGYCKEFITSPGSSQSVTVGTGGSGGSLSNGSGGGASSFGSFFSASGGSGGMSATGPGLGGTGGNATGGTINIVGQRGFATSDNGTNLHGGSGGSSMMGFGGPEQPSDAVNGADGQLYGGGGAGASSNGSMQSGGDGADGIVIVWEYS